MPYRRREKTLRSSLMANPETRTNGIDTFTNTLVEASRGGQEEAIEAWARGCDLYSRYFAALAKAQGPEGVFAANADFVTSGMEAFARSASAARRLNGQALLLRNPDVSTLHAKLDGDRRLAD